MKISRLIVLIFSLAFFFSCKSQLTVRKASWYTWAGGQPGVGGVKYQIVLDNKKEKPFTMDKLMIDGQELEDLTFSASGDSIIITASEKEKRTQPTLNDPNPPRSKLRSTDPESAVISGLLGGKQVKIEVDSFIKEKPISYQ